MPTAPVISPQPASQAAARLPTVAGTNGWLFINTTGNDTFSGTLADGGTGALGLNKQGTGRLTLTGASSDTESPQSGGYPQRARQQCTRSEPYRQPGGWRSRSGIELEGGISLPGSVNFSLSNDGAGADSVCPR